MRRLNDPRRGNVSAGYLLILGVLLFVLVPALLYLSSALSSGALDVSIELVEIFGIESDAR